MWYWIFRAFFTIVIRLFFKFKVEGVENIPRKTNFIVVANHNSWMDPVVLGVAVPKKINYIALRDLFEIGWLRWYIRLMEALPTGSSSKKAIDLLVENKNVGLFPEGGCSRDGKLKKFRKGAALLGIKTGRPIMPCVILGTFQILPRGAKFPKLFRTIKVKVGRPIYLLKEFEEAIDDIYLQQGTFKIRKAIEEMLNGG